MNKHISDSYKIDKIEDICAEIDKYLADGSLSNKRTRLSYVKE